MSSKNTTQPSTSRRKSSKRILVQSDDDDDQRTKRARTTDTDASLDDDMDMDVDVGGDDDDTTTHEPSPSPKQRKRKGLWVKKPQMVHSEDEESERDIAEDDLSDATPPAEHSDDDFDVATPPRRKAKTGPSKGRAGKTKPGQLKGAKARSLKDKDKDREVHMKDERKSASTPRASAHTQPSDLFSNEDIDAPPDATKDQTIPKKRKLPPIKKTKTAGTTGTQTPSSTAQKPAPLPAQESAKPLPTSEQRKQASTGARDLDLGDSKVYAELFKGAGGSTPRSGLKNAEERRKELDRMRDEARARRNEEAKYTFDLQSQGDKIARFERRLRAENSTVLHPNFLAAKFRDEWELDRRNRRGTPKEEGEA